MTEWLNRAFSGGVSLERVNPIGIALIILAVVVIAAARFISGHFADRNIPAEQFIRLTGLFLCAVGTAVAIL